jgi:hypothetical protein
MRDDFVGYAKEVFDLVARSKFDGIVHEIYPLAEVARTHSDSKEERRRGNYYLRSKRPKSMIRSD